MNQMLVEKMPSKQSELSLSPHVTFRDAVGLAEEREPPSVIRNVALQLPSIAGSQLFAVLKVKMINCDTARLCPAILSHRTQWNKLKIIISLLNLTADFLRFNEKSL